MFTFIILYFLNLVLDYPLQGTFLAEYKCKNNYILFVHCAIWGIRYLYCFIFSRASYSLETCNVISWTLSY